VALLRTDLDCHIYRIVGLLKILTPDHVPVGGKGTPRQPGLLKAMVFTPVVVVVKPLEGSGGSCFS
jgi:hypothetical protein